MVQKKKYFNFIMLLLIMVLVFPAQVAAAAVEKESLSIQEAIDTAFKSNPDLNKAYYQVEKTRIQRNDAVDAVTYIPDGGLVSPQMQAIVNTYQQADIGWNTAKKNELAEKDRVSKEVIAAYVKALKDYNSLQNLQLTINDLKEQRKLSSIARELGMVAILDYDKSTSALKQAEESYKAMEAAYQGDIASLASLLGKSSGWNVELSSRLATDKYERNSLDVEISRGTSESILVWTKKALLDIEESKKNWWLPNENSAIKKIDLNVAEIDYEQAKRTARASIEQLYYGIDGTEGQIESHKSVYAQAQTDLKTAQLKYQLGLIPARSLTPGGESLVSAQLAEEKARISLENARADLVNMKAQFTYLTGQKVYDPEDWTTAAQKN